MTSLFDLKRKDTGEVIAVTTDTKSKQPGALLRFGRNANTNDILLPNDPRSYARDHFSLYLADSGELLLKDQSGGQVEIYTEDVTAEEQGLYNLKGKAVRQRVIPRALRTVMILCGRAERCTEFELDWDPGLLFGAMAQAQDILVQHAFNLADPLAPPTVPATSDRQPRLLETAVSSLRSWFTPGGGDSNIARFSKQKDIHKYHPLGEGTFGVVWKAVDLATGELWAVKELRASTDRDSIRRSFKHIAESESFQGFSIGGPFQIFYKLYRGNVRGLIAQHRQAYAHNCVQMPRQAPDWAPRFTSQFFSAMQYLIQRDVIHRDIKPENILYDYEQGILNFYLADFGLATTMAMAGGADAGSRPFMTPEAFARGVANQTSDVWSFAITLGCVLGYWCEGHCLQLGPPQWISKLTGSGVGWEALGYVEKFDAEVDSEVPDQELAQHCRWIGRVMSLVRHGLLPPMFGRMLDAPQARMTFDMYTDRDIEGFVSPPARALQSQREVWEFLSVYR